MTSGYMPESMPEKGEPGFDKILRILREDLKENPRLREMPAPAKLQLRRWLGSSPWADTWRGSLPSLWSRKPSRAWRPKSRVSRMTSSPPRRRTPREQLIGGPLLIVGKPLYSTPQNDVTAPIRLGQ